MDAKRYERPSNNGRLDPMGRAYRHFSSWNRKHYGITKTDYGEKYWKTVEYGINNAEEILLLKMTQQEFIREIHKKCSEQNDSVKIKYIIQGLPDEVYGMYKNLPVKTLRPDIWN